MGADTGLVAVEIDLTRYDAVPAVEAIVRTISFLGDNWDAVGPVAGANRGTQTPGFRVARSGAAATTVSASHQDEAALRLTVSAVLTGEARASALPDPHPTAESITISITAAGSETAPLFAIPPATGDLSFHFGAPTRRPVVLEDATGAEAIAFRTIALLIARTDRAGMYAALLHMVQQIKAHIEQHPARTLL